TSNHLFFAGLVPLLPGVRIIGPDLRGRADSRLLPGPFGMRVHAEDVLTAIETFSDSGTVTLVGHSMGGFVAMTLAGLPAALGADDTTTDTEATVRFRGPVLIDGGLPLPLALPGAGEELSP
ncbi:alpha/beta hydrolase, partial [Burkholderia multivorans]